MVRALTCSHPTSTYHPTTLQPLSPHELKKETVKLRSEVSGQRMATFEHDILQQELRGAKDAANAMEAQGDKLGAENLRHEIDGLIASRAAEGIAQLVPCRVP